MLRYMDTKIFKNLKKILFQNTVQYILSKIEKS
jgi:hypothetical protein